MCYSPFIFIIGNPGVTHSVTLHERSETECFTPGYEGCSNMNASSFIIYVTYMLRQNGIRFYKGIYVTFYLAPDLKENTV